MNLTDIIKEKASISDVTKLVMGDELYLGYWSDIDGSAVAGNIVSHNSEFWQAVETIVDITLSEPSDSNDSWFKRQDAVFDFVVSQYAGGDESLVGYIYKGLSLSAFNYFVWPDDGRVFSKNGATGTFSDPLDFDPDTGIDSGVTGTLSNVVPLNSSSLGDSALLDTATAAEITAGVTGKVVTDDELAASIYNPNNGKYESAPQELVLGGTITVSHGLGSEPLVQILGECKVATSGFSVGDRILLNPNGNTSDGSSRSASVLVSDTIVSVYVNSSRAAWWYNNLETVDYSEWDLIVKAWV